MKQKPHYILVKVQPCYYFFIFLENNSKNDMKDKHNVLKMT